MSLSRDQYWGFGFMLGAAGAFVVAARTPAIAAPGLPSAPVAINGNPQGSSVTPPPAFQFRAGPDYQIFARNLTLPPIAQGTNGAFLIGSHVLAELGRAEVPPQKLAPVASQLGVPAPFLNRLLSRLAFHAAKSQGPPPALELQQAVIDYRYLAEKWNRYRPATGGEALKQQALTALQAGELQQAWALYQALPRPAAPAGLRVVH